jgi:hypothetical protein
VGREFEPLPGHHFKSKALSRKVLRFFAYMGLMQERVTRFLPVRVFACSRFRQAIFFVNSSLIAVYKFNFAKNRMLY